MQITPRFVTRHPAPARLLAAALAIAAGLLAAPRADANGGTARERHVIENARAKFIFMKLPRTPGSSQGIIGLLKVIDLATGAQFKTIYSPFWSVELRSLFHPGTTPTSILVPPRNVDPLIHDLTKLCIVDESSDRVRLVWNDVPVPGTAQTLHVEATVTLRPDLASEWDIAATVTAGDYGVYAVRFPHLAVEPIGASSTNDRLVSPINGGIKVADPVNLTHTLNERGAEGSRNDGLFGYPGNVFTQFMAFYDPSVTGAGLYVQAEDPDGSTKNLYFNSGNSALRPAQRRLYMYFTHFNHFPSVGSGVPAALREADFRAFGLVSKLGYPMRLETFRGDWIDAALLYRGWVTARQPSFLPAARLEERTDISEDLKHTAYGLRWALLPGAGEVVDDADEYARVQAVLDYYSDVRDLYDPARTLSFEPFLLPRQMELGLQSVAGDGTPADLRPGVVPFLESVRTAESRGDLPVFGIAINRDTQGINYCDGSVPGCVSDPLEPAARAEGVMWTSKLVPMVPKAGVLRTCPGTPWLTDHRADAILDLVTKSVGTDSEPGFTIALLSGNGNWSYCCYAPGDESGAVDAMEHDHPAGGGSYNARGWHDIATEIRARALAEHGIDRMFLVMEHQPETALADFAVSGHSWLEPLDDTAPGPQVTVAESVPVPLFKYLYHDFSLWEGDLPWLSIFADVYGVPHPDTNLHGRFRAAQISMMGRFLGVNFARSDPGAPEDRIPGLDDIGGLEDVHDYTAALSVLRSGVPEFLVFGRGLRDPDVAPMSGADSVSLPLTLFEVSRPEFVVPRVVGSAWADDATGHVGVLFTNFTPQDAMVVATFTPRDYGLAPGQDYTIQRKATLLSSWADTPLTFNGSDASVAAEFLVPAMETPGEEPWALFRIVPAP